MTYTSNVDTQKANEYLDLCNDAENAFMHFKRKTLNHYQAPNGYSVYNIGDKTSLRGSHFKSVIFQKGDKFVISFFGTDFKSPKDIYTNLRMVTNGVPQQFTDAVDFAQNLIDKNIPPENITVIGNSEGGAEAIYVKASLNLPEAYTFNPYIPDMRDFAPQALQNIYNFRSAGDIVSKAGGFAGEDFIIPLKNGFSPRKGAMKAVDCHRIDNLGDCNEAVPAKLYKNLDGNFVNKYKKERLNIRAINEIPTEMYDIFEKEIMCSILTNGFDSSSHSASECPIIYSVSGYTRQDGKKVSGYTRHCGAKHHGL